MSRPALRLRGVTKRYGKNTALDALDLEVPAGALCGLIGPNGAGKTTTFGVTGGLVRADAGEVDLLNDGPFDAERHKGRLGLLPQDCELNPSTPVRQLLVFYARLQGMDRRRAEYQADKVLEAVDLSDRAGARIRQLSHGMRRRVAVAQALIGEPALVLLDEPTSGLDPHLVVRMRELFLAQKGRRTLLISSHQLAELEAVCDHVIFMEKGRVVRAGTLHEVTGRGTEIRLVLARAEAAARAEAVIRETLPDATTRLSGDSVLVEAPAGMDAPALNAALLPALVAAGAPILEVRSGRSLEDRYMEARAEAHA